ncbi:MAG: 4-alpha-glucanotransferase [Clostridia bacterium]|nr:4-alpha-glucanotransferase [Clostridia bacterium]
MRTSGILMPIFSLPSKYGIGTFGKAAYNFVDFLKKSGQTYWQILPLGITGFGNSPYQSVSSYAGNPFFIDLEMLCEEGLADLNEIESFEWGDKADTVDYELIKENKIKILKSAFAKFKNNDKAYKEFKEENAYWLNDFSLYSALKEKFGGISLSEWDEEYLKRDQNTLDKARTELKNEIEYYNFVQFLFASQWKKLKDYANENGIYIVGDIPIYVVLDSADVWSDKNQFLLDDNYTPKAVAGCPPDAFSEDGQLWGNPLYDWQYMKKDNYSWWIKRIDYCTKIYDVVRIDHFRAFSAYYSIPYGDKTAVNGKWIKGPGRKLFDTIEEKLGKLNIIAEDLGTIDEDVRELLKYTRFPGMKVLQFAFSTDSESSYLPHNITDKNCVVYTGTHDNDTAIGYMLTSSEEEVKFVKDYLRIGENDSFNWSLIKSAMATPADTVILQMQDFLGLDNAGRINTPGTTVGNWKWRIDGGCINDWLAKIIYDTTKLYFRLPKDDVK